MIWWLLAILYCVICYVITFIGICVIYIRYQENLKNVTRTNEHNRQYTVENVVFRGKYEERNMRVFLSFSPVTLPIYLFIIWVLFCFYLFTCVISYIFNAPNKIANYVKKHYSDFLQKAIPEE